MDEPKREAETVQDPPTLCNLFSDQIIGMTFGEEKAMLARAPRKPGPPAKPDTTTARQAPEPEIAPRVSAD